MSALPELVVPAELYSITDEPADEVRLAFHPCVDPVIVEWWSDGEPRGSAGVPGHTALDARADVLVRRGADRRRRSGRAVHSLAGVREHALSSR